MLHLLYLSGQFNDLWNTTPPSSVRPTAADRPSPRLERIGSTVQLHLPEGSPAPRLLDANGRLVATATRNGSSDAWTFSVDQLRGGLRFVAWRDGERTGAIPASIGVR